MATYSELFSLANGNNNLLTQVTSAVAIAADAIRQEADTVANHADRLLWAKQAFADPQSMAKQMIWAVLAANASATSAAIQAATDAQVQTAVNNVLNIFANG